MKKFLKKSFFTSWYVILIIYIVISIIMPISRSENGWVKGDMGEPIGGPVRLWGLTIGDGDKDGKTDVYITGGITGGLYQYSYNQSRGDWEIINITDDTLTASALAFGDGDDDGTNEIYFQGMTKTSPRLSPLYQVYYTGDKWSLDTISSSNPGFSDKIVIGDGNNDDKTEVFSANQDGNIYMYYKKGEWNCQNIGTTSLPQNQTDKRMLGLAVGDADNDDQKEVYGSDKAGQIYQFKYNGSIWMSTIIGLGGTDFRNGGISNIVIGDLDGDGQNEIYGISWTNVTVYRFKYDSNAYRWETTKLISLNPGDNGLSIVMGDGKSEGANKLYAGSYKGMVYEIFYDNITGKWMSSNVGSCGDSIYDVAIGSAMGISGQQEVYAVSANGHGYFFLVDRNPPANPIVWSDTHPVPGTWYNNSVVHVLWSDIGKDTSGINGYSILWDNNSTTIPDSVKDVGGSVHDATSPNLSPGKWYFYIRAMDNSLNWNISATRFGPICIGSTPDSTAPIIRDVVVSGITDKLAVVSWATDEPADSTVEFGISPVYGLRVSNSSLLFSHSLIITNLSPSTLYHFRVISSDTSGNLAESGDYSFTTNASADKTPPIISNVKVIGITETHATVTWKTDEPGDSVIYYGITAEYGSSKTDDTRIVNHEITIINLTTSTTYHFKVASTDATGNGPAFSDDFSFTTLNGPDRTPPSIFNIRVEAITANSVVVSWETDEFADSHIQYGTLASYGLNFKNPNLVFLHTAQIKALSPNTIYHFQITSTDSSNNTGIGEDMTFRTALEPSQPDTIPPIISDVVVGGITNTRAVIMWYTDELADSEVDYGKGLDYGQKMTDAADTIFHSLVLEGLSPSTIYHVKLKSTDVFGNGPSSSQDILFTTSGTPDTIPPKISSVRVMNMTRTSATITWITDEPADSVIEYGTSTSYGQHLSSKSIVLKHSIVLTGLSPGKTYHFHVGSDDPTGNHALPSGDHTFTTLTRITSPVGTPLPWLWIGVVILVTCLIGIILLHQRYESKNKKAEHDIGINPAPDHTTNVDTTSGAGYSNSGPSLLVADPANDKTEDIETLQMETSPMPSPIRYVRCKRCESRIPIFILSEQQIRCPNCGATGTYRPKA